jgi:hypothetical protein
MAIKPIDGNFRKAFQDFSGGLNTLGSPLRIDQNQFVQLDNCLVNETGLLEKSQGYSLDGSPFPDDVDSFIRMLVHYRRGTTVDKLVCAAQDDGNTNATYKVDLKETSGDGTYSYIGYVTGTATFTNGSATVEGQSSTAWSTHLKAGDKIKPDATSTWYEIQSVTDADTLVLTSNFAEATQTAGAYKARIILHKDFIPQAITFNNNLIITNGSERMISYNNTSTTLITDADAPRPKYLKAHKNRVFGACTTSSPSGIFWSAVADETSWDAAAVEEVFENDGGIICAIESFADSLIVMKDNGSMYQVVGSFDQDAVGEVAFIRKIDTPSNMGAIMGNTVAVHDDNTMWFLTETGFYQLDQRMQLTKVSSQIQENTDELTLRPTATSNKTYAFDTKSQWDLGTHSGTKATTDGTLQNYFDLLTITDAYQTRGGCSVAIDSSNNVHVAYIDASNSKLIKYKKWTYLGVLEAEETALTYPTSLTSQQYTCVSIALRSDGTPAIAGFGFSDNGSSYNPACYYTVRSGGSWSAIEMAHGGNTVFSSLNITNAKGLSMQIRSDNEPRIVIPVHDSTNQAMYLKRTSGTWTTVTFGDSGINTFSASLLLQADSDPRIAVIQDQNSSGNGYTLRLYSGGGAETSLSLSGDGYSFDGGSGSYASTVTDLGLQLVKTSAGVYISAFCENGDLTTRSHVANTTAVVAAGTYLFRGYQLDGSDTKNYLLTASNVESFTFETSNTITNTGNTTAASVISGDKMMARNGATFAVAFFGANSNEILVRRLAYRAVYTTAEQSDSTLSAWSTYDVSGQTTNGNTITHEVAVDSSPSPASFSSITSGTVVSSDATKVYFIGKVTILLAAFAQSSVESVIVNYTGSGIDGKVPYAVVFDNEYYCTTTQTGESANNQILFSDRDRAWIRHTGSISCFARFNQSLYAGCSTSGKVFKMHQGYRQESSAYTMTAVTKEDLLGSLELFKDIYKVYVIYKIESAGTFTFSYRLDNFKSQTEVEWTDQTIDVTRDGIAEVHVGQVGQSIQFKISNSTIDIHPSIVGFVVLYGYNNLR